MKKLIFGLLSITLLQLNLQSQEWEALDYSYASFSLSVPHLGVSKDNMKIATSFSTQYAGPMELSTDGGDNWSAALDKRVLSIQFDDAGNIYALHQSKDVIYFNGFLYKSTDNGQNWEEILDVDDYVETVGFKVTGSGEIYVPSAAGLDYSPDGGATWTEITCNHVPYGVLKTSTGRLIISTYNSGVEYSDDNGASWTNAEGDLGNISFGFLQEHPTSGNIYVCSFGGVLESTDNGASFYLKDPDPWVALNIKKFEISKAGKFYIFGLYGVLESSDAVEWTNINGNLPAGNGYDMDMSDDHIYVVVDTMIYKHQIESVNAGIYANKKSSIQSNVYPNPTKGFINIEFNLEKREAVSISIRNMKGQVVAEKVWEALQKGTHTIPMNLSELQSGIYIATIRSYSGLGVKRVEIIN